MTYTVSVKLGMPYIVALISAGVSLAIIGAILEKFLFRPVIKKSVREESTMLLAAGVAFFLDAAILLLFGEKQRGIPKIRSIPSMNKNQRHRLKPWPMQLLPPE